MIEIEATLASESSNYQRKTEEHLNDQKQVIKGKEIRIQETKKEFENRIVECNAELESRQSKLFIGLMFEFHTINYIKLIIYSKL